MIGQRVLSDCDRSLFIYDVTQSGWEQEPNGFSANVVHVLTHLVKDNFRKNFEDPVVAREALAPDNLMYALRLARWGNFATKKIIYSMSDAKMIVANKVEELPYLTAPHVSHQAAMDTVADLLHDEAHARIEEEALAQRLNKTLRASRFLLYSSELLAERFDFDLQATFNDRLVNLRERFDIPEPPASI